MDGTDDDMLWNGSEEDQNVRNECKKALTVKMETVILVKVERIWYVLCIKCLKLMVKYFLLADLLFGGVVLN